MKKILIALALIFPAFFAAAQEIPAGMRMELAEITENDDQFSIFKYKDEDGSVAYYLSVGREFNVVEAVFGDVSNISLGHVDETVLCLGKTYDEAQAFLESMLALFDKEPGTSMEFPARLSVGAEKLGSLVPLHQRRPHRGVGAVQGESEIPDLVLEDCAQAAPGEISIFLRIRQN